MVPWADMYNHSHTTLHDRCACDGVGMGYHGHPLKLVRSSVLLQCLCFRKLFCRDLKAFMVYADRAYEANKQVVLCVALPAPLCFA